MLRTPSYPKLTFALTLFCGLVSSEDRWLLGQAADNGKCSREVNSLLASPAPHSPPILTPPQNPGGLWNHLARQQPADSEQLPNASSPRVNLRILPVAGVPQQPIPIQASAASAVTMPISDETEKAITEVRIRLGNAGNRFSDLLSPEDESRLFAEALNQVRQEQQPSAAPQPTQLPPVPQAPSATPYQVPLDRPGPGLIPPPAVLPPLVARPPAASYPNPTGGQPQLHWAPGQPNPPPSPISNEQPAVWGPPGNQPAPPLHVQPGVPQPETEQAAMRRIARQVDALAEQLETINRYSEADSLRRSAQQFREAVR